MTARSLLLCLALLVQTTFSRAADFTNSLPPATSLKSPADIEGSPEWVAKKILETNSEAVLNLGTKYATGDGVPLDGKKAVQLFLSVAAGGDSRGEYFMSLAFSRGVGVQRDDSKALDWMLASAFDGYAPAQYALGQLFRKTPRGSPDLANAFAWNARAAAQGYPLAETDIGGMYEEGTGVEADIVEALKWLQIGVAAGDKNAIPRLQEVMALSDASQKQAAQLRVRSFKPVKPNIPVPAGSKLVTISLGSFFQIPVKVFGKTNFIIPDTGAFGAVFDAAFQKHLGEPLARTIGSTLSTSKANFTLWDCPEIFIGERRFAPLLVCVEDFQKLRQVSGDPILGFVGMSILKREVLCFDSDNHTLSLGGSVPDAVKKNALAVPLILQDDSSFCIEAFINGRGPVLLAMDTGDDTSIDLNESDWQKVFAGQSPKSRRLETLDVEGKIADGRLARLQTVTIGTNTYRNLICGTVANPEVRSRFGQTFIRRHMCYVDFPHQMLYLQPGRNFDRPQEDDMSGLSLLNIDGKIIGSVDDKSPAYKAGIRTDDQILSINGQDVASLQLESIRETLKTKPGAKIKMQVKHGGQTNSVTFRLKRLL